MRIENFGSWLKCCYIKCHFCTFIIYFAFYAKAIPFFVLKLHILSNLFYIFPFMLQLFNSLYFCQVLLSRQNSNLKKHQFFKSNVFVRIANCSYRFKLCEHAMEQHALKNVNNFLNTNIYSYLETSGGQSSNLYLNVVHFFNTSAN